MAIVSLISEVFLGKTADTKGIDLAKCVDKALGSPVVAVPNALIILDKCFLSPFR